MIQKVLRPYEVKIMPWVPGLAGDLNKALEQAVGAGMCPHLATTIYKEAMSKALNGPEITEGEPEGKE